MTAPLVTYRSLGDADRPELGRLLRAGGPADAYLAHTLLACGPSGFHGAFRGAELFGALWHQHGAVTVAAATPPDAARILAGRLRQREHWSSVVGPEEPCRPVAELFRDGRPCRVDRVQVFMAVHRGDDVADGEPDLEEAVAGDVDELVPLVARYRVEDRLAHATDDHRAWIRSHMADRIRARHVFVLRRNGSIVFTGSYTFLSAAGSGLGGIYTCPASRGQGIARRGTAEMVRRAFESAPFVTLHVAPDNASAVACYERAGFRRHGRFRLTFR